MADNPYEAPSEAFEQSTALDIGRFPYLLFGTATGAVVLVLLTEIWAQLNFLTPNRHIIILIASFLGGLGGGVISNLSYNRNPKQARWIPTRYHWFALAIGALLCVALFDNAVDESTLQRINEYRKERSHDREFPEEFGER